MTDQRGTIRIEALGHAAEPSEMAENVRTGLTSAPKDLSPWPKYFYDAEGSRLFEEITDLPEYYQTRTELSILRRMAEEIVSRTRCTELVELGSGSASKTRTLLDAMCGPRSPGAVRPRYVPLDVSESTLRESAGKLAEEYPGLKIHGYVGDFDRSVKRLLDARARETDASGSGGRLVAFLGGTVGNFTPARRRTFLAAVCAGLRPGDHLLIGVDLVKDAETLEAAYNDATGVTARFNKNLLNVLNEQLEAQFNPDLFVHRAFYDARKSRIEMWLYSSVEQTVTLAGPGLDAHFGAGEGMRTEISAKFTRPAAESMLEDAGFIPVGWYMDEEELFGLILGIVRS
ncbi:MAG: L-histidine N(alpha)-methyltransferase [Actinomycetota bacterium]|nr:L-histidine N(alpha)-methyltransferase [Actinomycetota bacterium]